MKTGDYVKNKYTGQNLGQIDRMGQLAVAVVNGSSFVPDDLEVVEAPKEPKPGEA